MNLSEAIAHLESLGSPGNIATFFKSEGITGHQRSPAECPVAQYLKRHAVGYVGVQSNAVINVYKTAEPVDFLDNYGTPEFLAPITSNVRTVTDQHEIGPNVGMFIHMFDTGSYADLYVPMSEPIPTLTGVAPHKALKWNMYTDQINAYKAATAWCDIATADESPVYAVL